MMISLHFDGDQIEGKQLLEDNLRPGVFHSQSQSWEQPAHFVINKRTNTVSFESTFLGSYTLFAGEQQQDQIFLPLIRR